MLLRQLCRRHPSLPKTTRPNFLTHSIRALTINARQQASLKSRILLNPITRLSLDILKIHWTIVKVPISFLRAAVTPIIVSGAVFLIFCGGYSLTYPAEWALSDHNVLLTGVLRVCRTVFNAAMVVIVMKWMYWGVEVPESKKRRGPPMGPSQNAEEEDLTPVEVKYKEVQHDFWLFAANTVAQTFLANGGIYIKLGQAMATYSSMFPPEFGDALKPLLTSIFERESGEVDHMFVRDLGGSPSELFTEFQRQPIAGASIAQVFLGKTDKGEKVAIKVQYHDIAKRFKTDKYTTLFLLTILSYFQPDVEFLKMVPHVFDGLELELDFVTEGKNAEQCARDLSHLDYLVIPKVHWDLSSRRILTMDFAEGVNLVDVPRLKSEGFDLGDIMRKLVRVFGEQVFNTGHVHSDPHPGNILVRKNQSGKTEVVLIDHGLYEKLSPTLRQAFAAFWHSVIIEDDETVQRSGREMGLAHPDIFATLLFFKAYGKMKKMGFGGGSHRVPSELSEEERKEIEEIRSMGHEMFNSLPKQLGLVIRNIRLTQGINLSFGIPVNRTRLMAEIAVRYSHRDTDLWTSIKQRMKFEWHFLYLDVRNRLLEWGAWVYSIWTRNETKDWDRPDLTQAVSFLRA